MYDVLSRKINMLDHVGACWPLSEILCPVGCNTRVETFPDFFQLTLWYYNMAMENPLNKNYKWRYLWETNL
jgi:hypothetical protein